MLAFYQERPGIARYLAGAIDTSGRFCDNSWYHTRPPLFHNRPGRVL